MSYPYPTREVIADGIVHVVGLVAAIVASSVLLVWASTHALVPDLAAISIYVGFLLLALIASAAYHLLPWDSTRPLLHRIDHAAIYFKIAGTYTPFVVLIGSAFAYVVLAGLWMVAIVGAIAKLSIWRTHGRGSLVLYLLMGWACILLLGPMLQTLPAGALWLIFVGGALYTSGTLFFTMDGLPFHNAIWHAFVLAASACFFAAVALSIIYAV